MTLAICIAALGSAAVWEVSRIATAQDTVTTGWGAGLVTGVAASLAMAGVLIVTARQARRAPARHPGAVFLVSVLIGASPAGAFVFTAPQPGPESSMPYVVTTAAAVAGMAYAATFAVFGLALFARALPGVRRTPSPAPVQPDRELLTALIGPCDTGWDVSWICDGRSPKRFSAATLTEVADHAAAVAAQLYLRCPSRAIAADFQIALFAHYYTGGPIFEVSGGPGAFTASDKASGQVLHGPTLEALLQEAESATNLLTGQYMFHWTRPVTALSPGTTTASAIGE